MFKRRFHRATKPCYRLPDLWSVEERPVFRLPPSTKASPQPDLYVNELTRPITGASAPGNWNDGAAAGSTSFNDGFADAANGDATNGFGGQDGSTENQGGGGDQACRNCGEGEVLLDPSLKAPLILLRWPLCS